MVDSEDIGGGALIVMMPDISCLEYALKCLKIEILRLSSHGIFDMGPNAVPLGNGGFAAILSGKDKPPGFR
jgi:hypothetical protein